MLGHTRAVHCIGVGGSGMSAIAEVLLHEGLRVSGSDAAPSEVTARLASSFTRATHPRTWEMWTR